MATPEGSPKTGKGAPPPRTLRKALGLILALVVPFTLGLVWSGVLGFGHMDDPRVESDSQARETMDSRLQIDMKLPDSAHHLYYASRGFQDADDFFAFSVLEEDFGAMLAALRKRGARLAAGHQELDFDLAKLGPDSWPAESRDPNWDMRQYGDLVTEEFGQLTIAYSPSAHRFFVAYWAL